MPSIEQLLRDRYPAAAYALFFEVRNATGFKGDRSADAVAMCLYPSRGLEVHGFEFKASRSDWLRELKDPRKAEGVCRYCDRWWIVAGSKGIVVREELPKTWGLLVAGEEALRVTVQAPLLEPVPLDRVFVASLLREAQKASERPVERLRESIRTELWQQQQAKEATKAERHASQDREKLVQLERTVREFEAASGVQIANIWDLTRIGAAVKMVLNSGGHVASELEHAANRFEHVAADARAAAAEIRGLGQKTEAA